jgi:oligopeptide/dipeptide ABC transporter ATP-binding protein
MTTDIHGSPVLQLEHLSVAFGKNDASVAIHDVSLSVRPGEIVGLVGESGSGKSLTCRSALRLMPRGGRIRSGQVRVAGRDVLAMSPRELRDLRSRDVGMIFQDPFTSLNPTLRIGRQLVETLRVNAGLGGDEAVGRAVELLSQVEIPEPARRLRMYPHELSGGMRQRVMLALALAANPALLIADEPTTALDVSTQAQVLHLIKRLRDERGMAVLLVSHDFGVIAEMCDHIVVMYGGFVVETGTMKEVYTAPAHPYTRALLDAVPDLTIPPRDYRRPVIPGPPLGTLPYAGGCPFAPRCRFSRPGCSTVDMRLAGTSGTHLTACPFVDASHEPAPTPAPDTAPVRTS